MEISALCATAGTGNILSFWVNFSCAGCYETTSRTADHCVPNLYSSHSVIGLHAVCTTAAFATSTWWTRTQPIHIYIYIGSCPHCASTSSHKLHFRYHEIDLLIGARRAAQVPPLAHGLQQSTPHCCNSKGQIAMHISSWATCCNSWHSAISLTQQRCFALHTRHPKGRVRQDGVRGSGRHGTKRCTTWGGCSLCWRLRDSLSK